VSAMISMFFSVIGGFWLGVSTTILVLALVGTRQDEDASNFTLGALLSLGALALALYCFYLALMS